MTLFNPLLIVLAALPVGALLSCRDQAAGGEGAPEKAEVEPVIESAQLPKPASTPEHEIELTGHLDLIEKLMALKEGFTKALISVSDEKSAREFEEGLEGRKVQLRKLLTTAGKLPAPDDGARRHFQTLQESFSDEGAPLMDQFFARVRLSPDRDAIEQILEKLSTDTEVEGLNRKLTEIYQ